MTAVQTAGPRCDGCGVATSAPGRRCRACANREKGHDPLRRLPLFPLLELAGVARVPIGHGRRRKRGAIPSLFGVSRRTIIRYLEQGVPVCHADRFAAAVNLNPVEVWGDDWWRP